MSEKAGGVLGAPFWGRQKFWRQRRGTWFGHVRCCLHLSKGPVFIFYDELERGVIEVGKPDIGGC